MQSETHAPIEVEAVPVTAELSEALGSALRQLDPIEGRLAEMRRRAASLPVIAGLDDRRAEEEVRAFLRDVVSTRTGLDKLRLELKRPALDFGKSLDARAKEITAKIEEIEAPIAETIEALNAERKRIAEEEAERERQALAERVASLARFGYELPVAQVAAWSDDEFAQALEEARVEHEAAAAKAEAERKAEEERIAEEARRAAEERAKLDAEREAQLAEAREMKARLEAQQAELEKAQAALREARERQEAAEAAEAQRIAAAERAESARLEALVLERRSYLDRMGCTRLISGAELVDDEEFERILAAERVEQERRQEAARAAKAEEEARVAAERERLRPDVEKLRAFAHSLDETMPRLADEAAAEALATIVRDACGRLFDLADGLEGSLAREEVGHE